jgi:hypothetical protein
VSTVSGLLRAVLERPVNDSIRSRNEFGATTRFNNVGNFPASGGNIS